METSQRPFSLNHLCPKRRTIACSVDCRRKQDNGAHTYRMGYFPTFADHHETSLESHGSQGVIFLGRKHSKEIDLKSPVPFTVLQAFRSLQSRSLQRAKRKLVMMREQYRPHHCHNYSDHSRIGDETTTEWRIVARTMCRNPKRRPVSI